MHMPTQLLLAGHLPTLLHPDPKRVLVIGMGSGITTGVVARHPVERIGESASHSLRGTTLCSTRHAASMREARQHA